MKIGKHQTHPAADAFPLMTGGEYEQLRKDIEANGLREPIRLHDGKVLDGRNRYRALVELKLAPKFAEYDGDDPVAYVVSMNVARRHLDESQRAMVASRLAKLPVGRPEKETRRSAEFPTQARAAAMLNVGERTVQNARKVLDHGVPEVVAAVDRGDLSVDAGSQIATLAPEIQRGFASRAWGGAKPLDDAAVKALVRSATVKPKSTDQRCKFQGVPCPTCKCEREAGA